MKKLFHININTILFHYIMSHIHIYWIYVSSLILCEFQTTIKFTYYKRDDAYIYYKRLLLVSISNFDDVSRAS